MLDMKNILNVLRKGPRVLSLAFFAFLAVAPITIPPKTGVCQTIYNSPTAYSASQSLPLTVIPPPIIPPDGSVQDKCRINSRFGSFGGAFTVTCDKPIFGSSEDGGNKWIEMQMWKSRTPIIAETFVWMPYRVIVLVPRAPKGNYSVRFCETNKAPIDLGFFGIR